MSVAAKAIANAIPLEIKKDAMRQTQSGDWKITFTVQASDMDQRLTSAAMGTRFQAALVEIGDDELPKGKLDWRDVQPAAQAGIRCAEPIFWAFLREELNMRDEGSADNAASFVRKHCKVNSRAHFNTNPAAKAVWQSLDNQFQAWKALQQ